TCVAPIRPVRRGEPVRKRPASSHLAWAWRSATGWPLAPRAEVGRAFARRTGRYVGPEAMYKLMNRNMGYLRDPSVEPCDPRVRPVLALDREPVESGLVRTNSRP